MNTDNRPGVELSARADALYDMAAKLENAAPTLGAFASTPMRAVELVAFLVRSAAEGLRDFVIAEIDRLVDGPADVPGPLLPVPENPTTETEQ